VRVADALTQTLARVAVAAAVTIMLAPVLLIVAVSFSGASYFDFPPELWSLRQYREAFGDPRWWSAVAFSLEVAAAVAVVSATIAVPAAFAIRRSRLPGRHIVYAGGLSGILFPISALAVALYGVMSQLGLRGTFVGLVLAHAILAVPIVLIVVTAALGRIPIELELAAMTAGASRVRAWIGVTIRLATPAILAGGLLAFVTSFDEAVLVGFLGGPEQTTLPKAILDSARFGVSPVITAVATLLMLTIGAVAVAALRFAGRRS
jgi:ABC-type spermidine/putrescine transport system permease subunit II